MQLEQGFRFCFSWLHATIMSQVPLTRFFVGKSHSLKNIPLGAARNPIRRFVDFFAANTHDWLQIPVAETPSFLLAIQSHGSIEIVAASEVQQGIRKLLRGVHFDIQSSRHMASRLVRRS